MARFHLMHCVPRARMHGLRGYSEVIQTVEWGLRQLGHSVSCALNDYGRGAVNIVFGAQVLSIDFLKQLPDDTIVYNFEQARGVTRAQLRPEVRYYAERFEIWEYSAANLPVWSELGVPRVKHVPVGWAPVISRIARPATQDIDVLLYGLTGAKRLHALHRLCAAGLTALFVSGLYGEARDELIGRSKIVLNVNLYDHARIFEVVRVSYLLANRKAVVATEEPATFVEADIASAVRFTTLEQIERTCSKLLEDDVARAALEEKGFEVISRRDIREILRQAIAPM